MYKIKPLINLQSSPLLLGQLYIFIKVKLWHSFPCYDLLRYVKMIQTGFTAMSHLLSVQIRFAPLVVYDYSRLYILGLSSFILEMCIRHTEYIYMVCNSCFHASKIRVMKWRLTRCWLATKHGQSDVDLLFDEIVLRMLLEKMVLVEVFELSDVL